MNNKFKHTEPIIEVSALEQMKQNGEWSKPILRGELLPTDKPTVVIRDVDSLIYYQPKADPKKAYNFKRLWENAGRITKLQKQFGRKSTGQHNVHPIRPLPVIVYFETEPHKEFLVSGYGRVEMFKKVGQKTYAFLRYKVESHEQLEAMMVHFNIEPDSDNLNKQELVSDLVDVIKKNPKVDVDRYIEDTYVHTDKRLAGVLKESAKEMISVGHTPKRYKNIGTDGVRWDEFVDKSPYNYMKFEETRNGWFAKTISFTTYNMFRDNWWTMWERYEDKGLKTLFYLDTMMPTGERNLCEMRLKCFNMIYRDWFFMCNQWGKPNKRKIFKTGGFHPTNTYKENQNKVVKIEEVLTKAKEYFKLGYKEFGDLITNCEKYLGMI